MDEIAYNTADLDDGFEARLLNLETILEGVSLFREMYSEVEKRHPRGRTQLKFNEALKRVLDRLATALIESTRGQIRSSGVASVEEVRQHPTRLARFSAEGARLNSELKKFLYANLYDNPTIVEDRERSVEALDQLFRYYLDHPEAMPPYYFEQTQKEPRHRVVCGYIAGMTDHFLLRLHGELLGRAAPASARK